VDDFAGESLLDLKQLLAVLTKNKSVRRSKFDFMRSFEPTALYSL
jgi:hypothetical protein